MSDSARIGLNPISLILLSSLLCKYVPDNFNAHNYCKIKIYITDKFGLNYVPEIKYTLSSFLYLR